MAIPKTITPGLAFNYSANVSANTPEGRKVLDQDFAELWDMGVRKLRTGMQSYNYSKLLTETRPFVLYAKAAGFNILHGVTDSNGNPYKTLITDPRHAAFMTAVVQEAQWAKDHNLDGFACMNEWWGHIDYSAISNDGGLTSQQKIDAINAVYDQLFAMETTLYANVKAIFTNGPVVACYDEAEAVRIIAKQPVSGMNGLDKVYFNMYDLIGNFKSRLIRNIAAFGLGNIGLTEVNNDDGYSNAAYSLGGTYGNIGKEEDRWAKDILERAKICRDLGIDPFYLFSYNQSGPGFARSYSLRDDTDLNAKHYRQALGMIMAQLNGKDIRNII